MTLRLSGSRGVVAREVISPCVVVAREGISPRVVVAREGISTMDFNMCIIAAYYECRVLYWVEKRTRLSSTYVLPPPLTQVTSCFDSSSWLSLQLTRMLTKHWDADQTLGC